LWRLFPASLATILYPPACQLPVTSLGITSPARSRVATNQSPRPNYTWEPGKPRIPTDAICSLSAGSLGDCTDLGDYSCICTSQVYLSSVGVSTPSHCSPPVTIPRHLDLPAAPHPIPVSVWSLPSPVAPRRNGLADTLGLSRASGCRATPMTLPSVSSTSKRAARPS
jgi:hypothetical protein